MRHAELFAGYGGLSLAVEAVFGAELAWYAEFDPAPSRIMARHWPDVPNHHDVTQIDWSAVEPVDIISGGSPCQDVSAAGRRAGMNEGTRSNLWVAMREAIAAIKPTYVVWENVRGAHSAKAHSEVESEPGLLGDTRDTYLRATGRVLGDLAGLGYDAEWRTVTASAIGAPHRRERVFVLAWRRDAPVAHGHGGRAGRGTVASGEGGGGWQDAAARVATGASGGTGAVEQVDLLPTVEARSFKGRNGGVGKGFGADINHAVESLLPTPQANTSSTVQFGRPALEALAIESRADFGVYAPAIQHWEQVLGRPAPPPTELSPRGKHRLSEHFTEWMMGLPEGWICDTPGITRRDAIKAAGNGVVPQQAYAALADMTQHLPAREASVP